MKFRPCIDLHNGKVKQIVGSSLRDHSSDQLITNYESDRSAADFARMYQKDGLTGGHMIMLGPGNEQAAMEALRAYPNGLQIGGGMTPETAVPYLEAGASHVIVTSYVFRDGQIDFDRLEKLVDAVSKERLVIDLSCRRKGNDYYVVTDRWQKYTDFCISKENLERLAHYCAEFLVHAVDVEGKCCGIEEELVQKLGEWSLIPTTYAGGVSEFSDMDRVNRLGSGKIDLTIGSALDLFGGKIRYFDAVNWRGEQ